MNMALAAWLALEEEEQVNAEGSNAGSGAENSVVWMEVDSLGGLDRCLTSCK